MSDSVLFISWCSRPIHLHRFRSFRSNSGSDADEAEVKSMSHDASSLSEAMESRQLIPQRMLEQLKPGEDRLLTSNFSDPDRGCWTEVRLEIDRPALPVLVLMYFDSDGPKSNIVKEIVYEQLRSISVEEIGLVIQYT